MNEYLKILIIFIPALIITIGAMILQPNKKTALSAQSWLARVIFRSAIGSSASALSMYRMLRAILIASGILIIMGGLKVLGI